VRDAGADQIRAWDHWIPDLQTEADALLTVEDAARYFTAILEYRLPRDSRRPDVIVLEQGIVVVVELKGRPEATTAGLDQVLAYARDLRAYHAACHDRPVVPVLVPASGAPVPRCIDGAWVVGPRGLHALLAELVRKLSGPPLDVAAFLSDDAYQPLPTLVEAARRLMRDGELPFLRRARAATDPALATISAIAREAATTKSRHLVLLTGVPGSGKTLVGLQLVHAHWLDELAVPRGSSKPTAPAVFLSGNGPLVTVLQDALKSAGGGGRTFVQPIKKYVEHFSRRKNQTPPEHLIVFDEAQRAHDAERAAMVHKQAQPTNSEPQHLLEFLRRVPEWCVLVALIGSGQAIHQGEEGGVELWREAIETHGDGAWTVHAPAQLESAFSGRLLATRWNPTLNLDTELRHHLVPRVHALVDAVLRGDAASARPIADEVHAGGFRFLISDDLAAAKEYLRERYAEAPLARFGLLASSKDKQLPEHGIDNTFQTTKRLRVADWFNAEPARATSCCQLGDVGTEFAVQGLELDMALLAWGSDLLRNGETWSIAGSRGTKGKLRDPMALRQNVYRVLLTRGRDGTVVFLPPTPEFAATRAFLVACGFRSLDRA
jgi:hypothetical protein